MSEIAGEVLVLIRPETTGFTEQATSEVSSAGTKAGHAFSSAFAKATVAVFAVGGLAEFGKQIVEGAAAHQAAFAVVDQTVKNAGAANDLYGQSIEQLLEKEARLKGFSDEDLASAFDRLVSVTHDSKSAFKDLGEAEDLARFRHIDVAQAALALAKAEQGSANSLQRYGIAAVKVTTDTDRLKAAHDAAVAAGAKFTAQQKSQYEAALKAAEAADKQASAVATLAQVQQRVGGTAATFAATASGQFARLDQDFHQFEVTIGEDLIPHLAAAAETLGTWFTELSQNQGIQHEFKQDIADVATAFHAVEQVVATVGPPIVQITSDLGGFIRVVELLGAAFAVAKISNYLDGLTAASAVEATATGTTAGYTTALVANTAALDANTVALGGEAAAATVAGDAAVANAGKLAIFSRAFGVLTKAAGLYLIVNQAIKALPGEHDLGLDFSNNTAKFVAGANGSPYQKGSEQDLLYQAGRQGKKGTISVPGGGTEDLSHLGHAGGEAYAAGLKAGIADGLVKGGGGFFGIDPTEFVTKAISDATAKAKKAAAEETAKATAKAAADAAAKATLQALAEGIKNDTSDLAQIKQNMADAITQGAQAVNQAVQQAKQNFNTIGQSLAGSIGQIIDQPIVVAQQRLKEHQDEIAAEFDRQSAALQGRAAQLQRESDQLNLEQSKKTLTDLRQEILLPGGHQLAADPTKALAQLDALEKRAKSPALENYILQFRQAHLAVQQGQLGLRQQAIDTKRQAADTVDQLLGDKLALDQDASDRLKLAAQRAIATWTDEFNKGTLSLKGFDQRVTDLLLKDHATYATAGKQLGVAFADSFQAEITGLDQQGRAILTGPHRAGTGLIPTIVRPLDTLRQETRQIASIAKTQRDTQIRLASESAKYLKTIAGQRAADNFTNSLTHNPGTPSKRQKELTGVTS